jgi:aryl-alcohol dehydrogenase-like predicted oxidoreductase
MEMRVPQLGFGTAPILGRVSRRASLTALQAAYDAGVRHFDTARSYGWGEAEGLLGEFLKNKPREDIRIVTKCGIVPAKRSPVLQMAKTIARGVLKLAPGLRKAANRAASSSSFAPSYSADVAVLKESFATSLAELKTPYVDVLLLHNYQPGMTGLDEVGAWFKQLKAEGKIRRYGFSVEGDFGESLKDLQARGLLADAIVQTPMTDTLLALPPDWRDVTFIAHSAIKYLKGGDLGGLLKRLGDSCKCEAVVCSMFTPSHLATNVAAWKAATI